MFAIRSGDGTWARIDLLNEAGGPGIAGRLVAWSDDRDGSTYAAARSDAGLILFERGSDGEWSVRNLSTELSRPRIDGELTVYIENSGRAHITGLTATGRLIDYKMMGTRNDASAWNWSFLNVSSAHLDARGRAMPAMAGPLTSFVTPRGSWNVTGLDAAGDIQLFFKERNRRWDVVNLSEFAGTPTLSGSLSVFQGEDRAVSIAGIAPSGNVWITEFKEADGWTVRNASEGKIATRRMRGGGLTSIVTDADATYIAGLNAAGRVVMYTYNPATDRWGASMPTNLVPGGDGPLLAGSLAVAMASDGTGISIVGQTATGRIFRYSWSPGGGWEGEDVSERLAG